MYNHFLCLDAFDFLSVNCTVCVTLFLTIGCSTWNKGYCTGCCTTIVYSLVYNKFLLHLFNNSAIFYFLLSKAIAY